MTLEDFFTISELKNGLSSAPRVVELLGLMQKDADSVPGNFPESARQWSAVAATIAATDDHHCLDLFLCSGGLLFLDRWLQDAQTSPENTASDSISAILSALERLQAGNEWPRSPPIRSTIRTLLQHSSPPVRDRAAALLGTCSPVSPSSSGTRSLEENQVLEDSSADSNIPAPDLDNNVSSGSEEGGFSKPRALSAIELEYGLMDALEVARKVANQVEKELVEEACSSSPSTESGGSASSRSPANSVSVLDIEPSVLDTESAPPALHCFDLNERMWSDGEEDGSFRATVSVVSASRAAAAPGRPSVPLRFEGSCGWKGSAVTSAFRPASPHCAEDRARSLPEIDLNVARLESEESPVPARRRPVIDLNRAADDDSEFMYCSVPARDFDLNGPYGLSDATPSRFDGRMVSWTDQPPVRMGPTPGYGFNGLGVGPTPKYEPNGLGVGPTVRFLQDGLNRPASLNGLMVRPFDEGLSDGTVDYAGGSGQCRSGLDLNRGLVEGGIRQLLVVREEKFGAAGLGGGKRKGVDMEAYSSYRNGYIQPPWL